MYNFVRSLCLQMILKFMTTPVVFAFYKYLFICVRTYSMFHPDSYITVLTIKM